MLSPLTKLRSAGAFGSKPSAVQWWHQQSSDARVRFALGGHDGLSTNERCRDALVPKLQKTGLVGLKNRLDGFGVTDVDHLSQSWHTHGENIAVAARARIEEREGRPCKPGDLDRVEARAVGETHGYLVE